ncbi:plancitoxin-1-like [Oppia nitens]|uniref:plancitoxin-1-like n=1 Tax=Oppia nitens TaxID=1686743 RepID=UPI0023DBD3CD|nr:plancitoxin-1-like [Oppia nitens]
MSKKLYVQNNYYQGWKNTRCGLCLKCLDETGSPVDWFIVYKVPKLEDSSLDTLRSGFGYTYITDKSIKTTTNWILSTKTVDQIESIFGRTVDSVLNKLKKSSDVSLVAYNDEKPGTAKSSGGAHAKGLFAIDSVGAFWMTHSMPKFPDLTHNYRFPDNAKRNGQTAICISIDAKDTKSIDNIAYQMLIMRPNIYDMTIQSDLTDRSNLWYDLKHKKWIKNITDNQMTIKSKNGLSITSFAKSNKYEKDIYSGLIATYFKENLLVQSWRNGAGGRLDSDCTDKYKVQNIDKIQIPVIKIKDVDWQTTEDHSKWGITDDNSGQTYTCIADINRMKSQFKRGGGSLCLESTKVWQIFKKSIEEVEGCPLKGHFTTKENASNRG